MVTELLPGSTCQVVCHTSFSSPCRGKAKADLVADLRFCFPVASPSLVPVTLLSLGPSFWVAEIFSSTTLPQPPLPLLIASPYLSTASGIVGHSLHLESVQDPLILPIPIHFSHPLAPPPHSASPAWGSGSLSCHPVMWDCFGHP